MGEYVNEVAVCQAKFGNWDFMEQPLFWGPLPLSPSFSCSLASRQPLGRGGLGGPESSALLFLWRGRGGSHYTLSGKSRSRCVPKN